MGKGMIAFKCEKGHKWVLSELESEPQPPIKYCICPYDGLQGKARYSFGIKPIRKESNQEGGKET